MRSGDHRLRVLPQPRRPLRRPRRPLKEGRERFDAFLDRALSGPEGFFTHGGGAGRRADFLTGPEVGPLFGAVVARTLDAERHRLGRPAGFTVVEAGAGRGTLARSVIAAGYDGRYLCVERSAALRAEAAAIGGVEVADDLPAGPLTGVVVANELLDNLPFRLFERTVEGWGEVWVDDGREVLVPTALPLGEVEAAVGARVPVQEGAARWLGRALGVLERGRVVVVDYADTTASMAGRPWRDWLRTYRSHGRGGHPIEAPGNQDVTCEVALDQLASVRRPDLDRSQAKWLGTHGIDGLVATARAVWHERAGLGDLEALRARSRVSEADALLDEAGLGAFRVLEWVVP